MLFYRIVVCSLLVFFSGAALAAPVPYDPFPVGARAVGAGGAFTGLADDLSAITYNPAGLFQMKGGRLTYQLFSVLQIQRLVDTKLKLKWEFFPLFAISRPLVPERLTVAGYFNTLFKSLSESYSVHVLGAAFSWKISDLVAVGLGGGLAVARQQEDDNWATGLHLQAGLLFRLSGQVKAGISFKFPLKLHWDYLRGDADVDETLPWILRAGLAWRAGEGLILTFDLELIGIKDITYSVSGVRQDPDYDTGLFKSLHPHFGVQYFHKKLGAWLRGGLMSLNAASSSGLNPQPVLTLGIGAFTSKFFKIDFSIADTLIFDIFSRTDRYERFYLSFEYTF